MSERQKAVWEEYVQSWKVASPEKKRGLYVNCLSPECVYTDPSVRAALTRIVADEQGIRVGKSRAGRILDGRTYDDMPTHRAFNVRKQKRRPNGPAFYNSVRRS